MRIASILTLAAALGGAAEALSAQEAAPAPETSIRLPSARLTIADIAAACAGVKPAEESVDPGARAAVWIDAPELAVPAPVLRRVIASHGFVLRADGGLERPRDSTAAPAPELSAVVFTGVPIGASAAKVVADCIDRGKSSETPASVIETFPGVPFVLATGTAQRIESLEGIGPLWAAVEGGLSRMRFFTVRNVDAAALAAILESVAALWRADTSEAEDAARAPEVEKSFRALGTSSRIAVAAADDELLDEMQKIAIILDRPRRRAGAESAAAGRDERPPAALQRIEPKGAQFQGKTVEILEGEVPVSQLLRFLADYSGLPVIAEEDRSNAFDQSITIVSPLRDADATLVEALLEQNGWLVERPIAAGRRVIRASRLDTQPIPSPRERPILRVR